MKLQFCVPEIFHGNYMISADVLDWEKKLRGPNLHISGIFIQSVRCLVDPTAPQRRRGAPGYVGSKLWCQWDLLQHVGGCWTNWNFSSQFKIPLPYCICVTFSSLKCVGFVSIPQKANAETLQWKCSPAWWVGWDQIVKGMEHKDFPAHRSAACCNKSVL